MPFERCKQRKMRFHRQPEAALRYSDNLFEPEPDAQPVAPSKGSRPAAKLAEAATSLSRLLSVKGAAAVLGISVAHLRREIRLKRLAVHRLGRLVRIAEPDLATYLAKHRRGAR